MATNYIAQPTLFVGRNTELSTIAELMNDPLCRLLTLTGPGGIGKTRLSIAAAQRQLGEFRDGFCFIPLQHLHSHEFITSVLTENLQCSISPQRDLFEQVLEHLQKMSLLLVMDNFEHLLDGAYLLSDILAHAPDVKILTTSRERLNLIEEWVYEVGGLSVPPKEAETSIETYESIVLFTENARRASSSFMLTKTQKLAVSRICRLVGGMPLAIELASAWVHVLPCDVIADELQHSLDILETHTLNVSLRHRNMRAAFEPTWNRLLEIERDVFKKLSVFRGNFPYEAAEFVAGASHRLMRALVDKSLLRIDDTDHYVMHPLLRQFGEEQLKYSPEVESQTLYLHAHYYLDFLREREQELVMLGAHTQAIERMLPNIENIRIAWEYGVNHSWLGELANAIEGYWGFHCMRGSSREGAAVFHATAATLRENHCSQYEAGQQLIALALAFEGLCTAYFNEQSAKALAAESMAILSKIPPGKAHFITIQLLTEVTTNDSERSAWIQSALEMGKTAAYGWWLPKNLLDLGLLARKHGNIELATRYYNEVLSVENRSKNPAAVVVALQGLGLLMIRQRDFTAAQAFAEQALQFAYEIHYTAAWWWLHSGFADAALLRGDYINAKTHYELALRVAQDVGQQYGDILGLSGLASVAIGMGDNVLAKRQLAEALSLAEKLKGPGALLDVLSTGANLFLACGNSQSALKLAKFVLTQPESEEIAQAKVKQSVEPGSKLENVSVEGLTLGSALQELREFLMTSITNPTTAPVEILTEREIEVLRFVAEGLSNHDIALRLFVGISTVKTHINHIYSKLCVKNRTQAVARSRELRLL